MLLFGDAQEVGMRHRFGRSWNLIKWRILRETGRLVSCSKGILFLWGNFRFSSDLLIFLESHIISAVLCLILFLFGTYAI